MHPYLAEQIASQHETELRALSADSNHAKQAQRARRAQRARQARQALVRRGHPDPRPIRRRAGWALVSMGLRLAYAAGED
jgi:hypothetical protein